MTENSNSPQPKDKVKSLLVQGMIGAISLTGATAIPLMVQRFMTPPTPVVTPASTVPVVPAQIQASPASEVQASPVSEVQASPQAEDEPQGRSRGRRDKDRDRQNKD